MGLKFKRVKSCKYNEIWEMGVSLAKQTFDFGAETDHDPDLGILMWFVVLRNRGNSKYFASNFTNIVCNA